MPEQVISAEDSKKFVFRNRESVRKKLAKVNIALDLKPTGKQNRWNGDPALIYSRPLKDIRFSGKYISLLGTNLFTTTSKMGAGSLSLPAGPRALQGTCAASKLPEVSPELFEHQICRKCYALKNNFSYELPQCYQATRYEWLKGLLEESGVEAAADLLAAAVQAYNGNLKARRDAGENPAFFRVHDSGDVWSEDYWELWQGVFDRCQKIRFWMPTRMHWIEGWRSLIGNYRAKNVVIRPSAYHFNDPAPAVKGLAAGSTGHYPAWGDPMESGVADFICPAYAAEGACVNAVRLSMGVYKGMRPGYSENPRQAPPYVTSRMKAMMDEYRKGLSSEERRITNDGWDCRVCWIRPDWSVSYKVH